MTLRHQCGIGPIGSRKIIEKLGLGRLADFSYLRPDELFEVLRDDVATDHAAAEAILSIEDTCEAENNSSFASNTLRVKNFPSSTRKIETRSQVQLTQDALVADSGEVNDTNNEDATSVPMPSRKMTVEAKVLQQQRQQQHLRAKTITGFNPDALDTMMRSCNVDDATHTDLNDDIRRGGNLSPGMTWALAQESPNTRVDRATWLLVRNVVRRLAALGINVGSSAPEAPERTQAFSFKRMNLGSNVREEHFKFDEISWEAAEMALTKSAASGTADITEKGPPHLAKGAALQGISQSPESGSASDRLLNGPLKTQTLDLHSLSTSHATKSLTTEISSPTPSVSTYDSMNKKAIKGCSSVLVDIRDADEVKEFGFAPAYKKQNVHIEPNPDANNITNKTNENVFDVNKRNRNEEYWHRIESDIQDLKLSGNKLLKQGFYDEANAKYTAAIDLCNDCFTFPTFDCKINVDKNKKAAVESNAYCVKNEDERGGDGLVRPTSKPPELSHLLAICLTNRAFAALKMSKPQAALRDALRASELSPSYAKASLRIGAAHEVLGEWHFARQAYIKAAHLDKTDNGDSGQLKKVALDGVRRVLTAASAFNLD